jgi:hypothetical protein
MQIDCPGCRKKYVVAERVLGKTLRCKACGTSIATPAPPRPAPVPREADSDLGDFGAYGVEGVADPGPELPLDELPVVPDGEPEPEPQVIAATPEERSRGVSLNDIRRRHSDLGKALKLYAQVMGTYHSQTTAAGHCAGCGVAGDFATYQATWKAAFNHRMGLSRLTALSIFGGGIVTKTTWQTLQFCTYHALCSKCGNVSLLKRIFGSHLLWVAGFGMIIYSLMMLVWTTDKAQNRSPGEQAPWAVVCLVAGVVLCVMPKWRGLPRRLSHIAQSPFSFMSMRKLR